MLEHALMEGKNCTSKYSINSIQFTEAWSSLDILKNNCSSFCLYENGCLSSLEHAVTYYVLCWGRPKHTFLFYLGMAPYMLPARIKILESVKSSRLKWHHSLLGKEVDFCLLLVVLPKHWPWDVIHDSYRTVINWNSNLPQCLFGVESVVLTVNKDTQTVSIELQHPVSKRQKANPGACYQTTGKLHSLEILFFFFLD